MIKAMVNGVLKLVIGLVNVILKPIDLAITAALPDLANAFTLINNFFDKIGAYLSWVLSYIGVYPATISMAVDLLYFAFVVPFTFNTIKLAIKWYNVLKL